MHRSPILSPSGEPVFVAGNRHSWKQATHRGFHVSLEWVGEGKRAQPCLCIWPEGNIFTTGQSPGIWVIGRRAITEFVGFNADNTCTGNPSEHCFREARAALPILGKDVNDQQALRALADVVIRFAPDLVHMPVTPKAVRQDLAAREMWDVVAKDKDSGRVLSEVAV